MDSIDWTKSAEQPRHPYDVAGRSVNISSFENTTQMIRIPLTPAKCVVNSRKYPTKLLPIKTASHAAGEAIRRYRIHGCKRKNQRVVVRRELRVGVHLLTYLNLPASSTRHWAVPSVHELLAAPTEITCHDNLIEQGRISAEVRVGFGFVCKKVVNQALDAAKSNMYRARFSSDSTHPTEILARRVDDTLNRRTSLQHRGAGRAVEAPKQPRQLSLQPRNSNSVDRVNRISGRDRAQPRGVQRSFRSISFQLRQECPAKTASASPHVAAGHERPSTPSYWHRAEVNVPDDPARVMRRSSFECRMHFRAELGAMRFFAGDSERDVLVGRIGEASVGKGRHDCVAVKVAGTRSDVISVTVESAAEPSRTASRASSSPSAGRTSAATWSANCCETCTAVSSAVCKASAELATPSRRRSKMHRAMQASTSASTSDSYISTICFRQFAARFRRDNSNASSD